MIDKKEAYRQKAEAVLDQLEARLEQMKAKLTEEGADAKIKLAEGIDVLEKQRDAARGRLDDILESGGETWEDLKDEADELFGDLKSGFERFMGKITGSDETSGGANADNN